MSLIGLVVVLIVIGVCLYLISLIPMDAKIQRIIPSGGDPDRNPVAAEHIPAHRDVPRSSQAVG